jgi:hypothetical protein
MKDFGKLQLDAIRYSDFALDHEQLDDLIESLICLLNYLEEVSKLPLTKNTDLYAFVRIGFLPELFSSPIDKIMVNCGVSFSLVGVVAQSENSEMEICNEDGIPFREFEGIN